MQFTLVPQTEELYEIYKNRQSLMSNRGDSGLDLVVPEDVEIPSGEKILLDLKVRAHLSSKGFFGICRKYFSYILMPRSSIAVHTPLMMVNSIGLIDSGYTGNLKVPLINTSCEDFVIPKGSRLVQLVTPNLSPIKGFKLQCNFDRVTERGENGFGSTK